jgi:hypothetical protein
MDFTVRRKPGSGASIEFQNPDSFTEFSVRAAADLAPAELDAALHRLAASYDGVHLFIAQTTIREAAGELGGQPEWNAGFARMVAIAKKHGWMDGSGNIRVHVQHL